MVIISLGLVIFLATVSASPLLAEAPVQWSPAALIRVLDLPGDGNGLDRPGAVFHDRLQDEIFVADQGRSRIVIFDGDGVFRHEIFVGDRCGVPVDLAVDPQGRIHLIGTRNRQRDVYLLDFDGLYLGEGGYAQYLFEERDRFSRLTVGDDGTLYLIHGKTPEALVFSSGGDLERRFTLLPETDRKGRQQRAPVIGAIAAAEGRLYVPISSLGMVLAFGADGSRESSYGHFGDALGELTFPSAVAVTHDGIVLVLDKHRFVTVCFDLTGNLLGEFGGRGLRPGWFYHPTSLAVGPANQVTIGQTFENRVQMCSLAESVVERHAQRVNGHRAGEFLASAEGSPPAHAEEEVHNQQ